MKPDRNPVLSYAEEERIRGALAAAARADGLSTPPRIENALVAELRRRNRRSMLLRVSAAGAIAAAVLVGLWLSRPVAPTALPAPTVVRHAEPPTPAIAPPDPAPEKLAAAPALRRPRPTPRRVESADAGEFIPVGAWQAFEPMERGAIVRVRLPKSSLPGFGIAVSADRWNESLPADVVLGEDGSMRAIRLVSNVE